MQVLAECEAGAALRALEGRYVSVFTCSEAMDAFVSVDPSFLRVAEYRVGGWNAAPPPGYVPPSAPQCEQPAGDAGGATDPGKVSIPADGEE
eukprot:232197-Alexandrium_andersonii.AAC.1